MQTKKILGLILMGVSWRLVAYIKVIKSGKNIE